MLFPTNGIMSERITAVMRDLCRSCPDSRLVAKISLDGPPDYHDKMRVVKGCYDKAMKTYEQLAGLLEEFPNFDLGVNTVLCSENQDLVLDFIDTVAATMPKITTHTVSLARGEMPSPELKNVQLEKYRQAVLKLEERMKNRELPVYRFPGGRWKAAQDIVQRELIYQTALQGKRLNECYAGTLNLVLAADGDLHPCEDFSMRFGNVKDHGFDVRKVLQTAPAQQILADIKAWKCHCTHECFMMTNTLFNPRMIPKIAREYVKLDPRPTVKAKNSKAAAQPS
jgi:radical SAM protein with 4Fe4S-binding SPASM domain